MDVLCKREYLRAVRPPEKKALGRSKQYWTVQARRSEEKASDVDGGRRGQEFKLVHSLRLWYACPPNSLGQAVKCMRRGTQRTEMVVTALAKKPQGLRRQDWDAWLENLLADFSAVIENFHPGTAGTSSDVLLTKDCIENRNLMPARTSVTGRHMACIEQGTVPPPLAFKRHATCKKPQVPRRWNTVKASHPLHRASHAPPGLESLFGKSAGGLSRSIQDVAA
jgi:hypothetical protein